MRLPNFPQHVQMCGKRRRFAGLRAPNLRSPPGGFDAGGLKSNGSNRASFPLFERCFVWGCAVVLISDRCLERSASYRGQGDRRLAGRGPHSKDRRALEEMADPPEPQRYSPNWNLRRTGGSCYLPRRQPHTGPSLCRPRTTTSHAGAACRE